MGEGRTVRSRDIAKRDGPPRIFAVVGAVTKASPCPGHACIGRYKLYSAVSTGHIY